MKTIEKEKIIYVNLFGRIGNNLFQLAAAASLAEKMEASFVALPFSDYLPPSENQQSLYEYLQQFNDSLLRNIDLREGFPLEYTDYYEPCFEYKEIPCINQLLLFGYFQSEKYFDEITVRNLFEIDVQTKKRIMQKYGNLLQQNPTSINVRRGDYLNKQNYHPVCTLEYFNTAIETIGKNQQFLITSDDLPWCKDNFVGTNFHFSEKTDPVENLYLQSLCANNIISNSSYSWWGAWLNLNKNKKVIAPLNWFGPEASELNTQDLLPDSWIKI